MSYIHNGGSNAGRMPVILTPELEEIWLNPNLSKSDIEDMMRAIDDEGMEAEIVGKVA